MIVILDIFIHGKLVGEIVNSLVVVETDKVDDVNVENVAVVKFLVDLV